MRRGKPRGANQLLEEVLDRRRDDGGLVHGLTLRRCRDRSRRRGERRSGRSSVARSTESSSTTPERTRASSRSACARSRTAPSAPRSFNQASTGGSRNLSASSAERRFSPPALTPPRRMRKVSSSSRGGAQRGDVLHRALHRGVGPRLDVEVQPAGEADRAEDAHRVLAQAGSPGRRWCGPRGRRMSRQPADEVDHPPLGDVVEEPVDGEVAPARVLLGGPEDVVVADEEIVLLLTLRGVPRRRPPARSGWRGRWRPPRSSRP